MKVSFYSVPGAVRENGLEVRLMAILNGDSRSPIRNSFLLISFIFGVCLAIFLVRPSTPSVISSILQIKSSDTEAMVKLKKYGAELDSELRKVNNILDKGTVSTEKQFALLDRAEGLQRSRNQVLFQSYK